MPATPPRRSASGTSAISTGDCRPTRASTSGSGSRTRLTNPAIAPTRCSPESGYPVPKIWEGVKGSPVTPVEDFNLETRPLLDEKIAARAAAFIKQSAEAGKPFFTYVCFTQMHPPLIHHPDFKGKSGGGVYSDTLAELDHRTGQVLDAIDQAGDRRQHDRRLEQR